MRNDSDAKGQPEKLAGSNPHTPPSAAPPARSLEQNAGDGRDVGGVAYEEHVDDAPADAGTLNPPLDADPPRRGADTDEGREQGAGAREEAVADPVAEPEERED